MRLQCRTALQAAAPQTHPRRRPLVKNKLLTALAMPLVAVLALAIGIPAASAAQDTQNKTSILVGADTTFPPFETEEGGKVTGFDIDMIRAIAKAENLDLTIKTMPFNGIIPSLQAGSIDAAVAGITIEFSRMKNVDFTNAYYKSGLSVLVRSDSDINGFDDLKGHVIATKKGTSSVTYLHNHGISGPSIKQYQNISSAYQALMSHGADAVLFDNPVNLHFMLTHKGVKTVGSLLTGEYYGIAVTKKEPKLVDTLNDGLAKIMQDGTYKKLFQKYFGDDTSGVVSKALTPKDVAVKD